MAVPYSRQQTAAGMVFVINRRTPTTSTQLLLPLLLLVSKADVSHACGPDSGSDCDILCKDGFVQADDGGAVVQRLNDILNFLNPSLHGTPNVTEFGRQGLAMSDGNHGTCERVLVTLKAAVVGELAQLGCHEEDSSSLY